MDKQHFVVYTMGIFVVFMVVNVHLIQIISGLKNAQAIVSYLCSRIILFYVLGNNKITIIDCDMLSQSES